MNFQVEGKGSSLRFEPQALIIAGFTGRSRAKVQEHIDEMRAHGVPIPGAVPTFYPVPQSLATTARAIEVATVESSGEVEPVLIAQGDKWYITLGSDHTARDEEKIDIATSKAACPKILCTDVWLYEEVRPHWDKLELLSWAFENGVRTPYQHGTCADIMKLDELVAELQRRVHSMPRDFIMCMGTLPLIPGKFIYSNRYEFELKDPVLNRAFTLGYDVRVNARGG